VNFSSGCLGVIDQPSEGLGCVCVCGFFFFNNNSRKGQV
jgi:hypothetical protein